MTTESTTNPAASAPTSATGNAETNANGAKDTEPTEAHLVEAENELKELLDRKRALDHELQKIEQRIYNLETAYLEDTSGFGNIIRGYDGYLNPRAGQKKQKISETERLFSMSSMTYQRAIENEIRDQRYAVERAELMRDDDSDIPVAEMYRKKQLKKKTSRVSGVGSQY